MKKTLVIGLLATENRGTPLRPDPEKYWTLLVLLLILVSLVVGARINEL